MWPCSLAVPVLAGGFLLFVVFCPGTPGGSTGSGSGFKASSETAKGLKSHLTDWENKELTIHLKDFNAHFNY